jgi:hypothetical protein
MSVTGPCSSPHVEQHVCLLAFHDALTDLCHSVVITQVPDSIACLDVTHIVTTVQGVPKVHQHRIQVVHDGSASAQLHA